MQNKFFLIIFFMFLLGCSSDKNTKSENMVNIFDRKNVLPSIIINQTNDAKLEIPRNFKNITNAKSYNLTNSLIKFPLKKIWQVNTDQFIDDENPYLPDPIYLSQNVYLLNNNGVLFKIEANNGKIISNPIAIEKTGNCFPSFCCNFFA